MTSATDQDGDLGEAELLAPWYVAGKLEEAEMRLVEELAYRDKDFAKLIEQAKQEAEAIASLNEAAGSPSPALWARIQNSVEEERKAQSRRWLGQRAAGVKAAVSSFFAGISAPQWQAVAAAAVAICVIEAGAIAYLSGGGSAPATFHVASGPKTDVSQKRSVFIVSFADAATIGEINKVLDSAGAVVVEGPSADMLYRIGLRNDSVGSKDQAYAKLQESNAVKLVLPEK